MYTEGGGGGGEGSKMVLCRRISRGSGGIFPQKNSIIRWRLRAPLDKSQ